MIIKTKKYALNKNMYVKIALFDLMKQQWWVALIYAALVGLSFLLPGTGWYILGITVALLLYVLFWAAQFAGVTQLDQNKVIFEKLSYEIDSRQILIKLNPKQGMPLKWDQIKNAKKEKDAFLLKLNKAHIIYLPFKIFNNDNEIKFMVHLLKQKELVKE